MKGQLHICVFLEEREHLQRQFNHKGFYYWSIASYLQHDGSLIISYPFPLIISHNVSQLRVEMLRRRYKR